MTASRLEKFLERQLLLAFEGVGAAAFELDGHFRLPKNGCAIPEALFFHSVGDVGFVFRALFGGGFIGRVPCFDRFAGRIDGSNLRSNIQRRERRIEK